MLDTIESLPPTFSSKTDFIHSLIAAGQTRTVAEWLASSLEKHGDRLRFALNQNEIRALLLDYFDRDLWPVVEQPPGILRVHLLIAAHSQSYSAADRERALAIAKPNPQVTADILPGGHWLHADNPDGVVTKVVEYLA